MDLITSMQPWHWLVVGLLLLGGEMLGAGGFVIGIAIASFIQSAITLVFSELSWELQLAIFAVNSVVLSVAYWRYFRHFNEATDAPVINDRAAQLIGRTFVLDHALINGQGKVTIGDTLWAVTAEGDIEGSTTVKVVDSQGMVLTIEPLS